MPPVEASSLPLAAAGEPSAAIRARVLAARAIQAARYRGMPGVHTNAEVHGRDLADVCRFTRKDCEDLVHLIERLHLSARAYDKVLRVARTIADLAESEAVLPEHLNNAILYRRMDSSENSFWL